MNPRPDVERETCCQRRKNQSTNPEEYRVISLPFQISHSEDNDRNTYESVKYMVYTFTVMWQHEESS